MTKEAEKDILEKLIAEGNYAAIDEFLANSTAYLQEDLEQPSIKNEPKASKLSVDPHQILKELSDGNDWGASYLKLGLDPRYRDKLEESKAQLIKNGYAEKDTDYHAALMAGIQISYTLSHPNPPLTASRKRPANIALDVVIQGKLAEVRENPPYPKPKDLCTFIANLVGQESGEGISRKKISSRVKSLIRTGEIEHLSKYFQPLKTLPKL